MVCVICGASRTYPYGARLAALDNFVSALEFLIEFEIVDQLGSPSSASESDASDGLCLECLGQVVRCDDLFSDLGRRLMNLRQKCSIKNPVKPLPASSTSPDPSSVANKTKRQVKRMAGVAPVAPNDEHSSTSRSRGKSDQRKSMRKESSVDDVRPAKRPRWSGAAALQASEPKYPVARSSPEGRKEAAASLGRLPASVSPAPGIQKDFHSAADAKRETRSENAQNQIVTKRSRTAPCPWCRKEVPFRRDEMFAHVVSRHLIPNGKQCWDCGVSFIGGAKLEDHLAEHRRILLNHVACIHCRKIVPSSSMDLHVQRAHASGLARTRKERGALGVKELKCSSCNFWCTSDEASTLHELQAHKHPSLACPICKIGFKIRRSLNFHIRSSHLKEPVVSCEMCQRGFFSWKVYFEHFPKKHRGTSVRDVVVPCSLCGVRLSPRLLMDHVEAAHGEGRGGRETVEETLALVRSFHRKEGTGSSLTENGPGDDDAALAPPSWVDNLKPSTADKRAKRRESAKQRRLDLSKCQLCEKSIFSDRKQDMYLHYEEAHKIPNGDRCWDCGMYFATKSELDHHLDEHRRNLLSCVTCIHCRRTMEGYGFKSHVKLRHPNGLIRTYTQCVAAGEKPIKCNDCNFWSTALCDVQLHNVQAHAKTTFACQECPFEFQTKHSLKEHVDLSHRNNLYRCEECGREFETRSKYDYHRKSHRRAKSLCENCGGTFHYKALPNHMMVCLHQMETIECPECGKKMKESSLRHHLANVHGSGEKEAAHTHTVCPECGHHSKGKVRHAAHMKSHHGIVVPSVREFRCKLCDKTCFNPESHFRHVRVVHGLFKMKFLETGLICTICGESFAEKKLFVEHLRTSHEMEGKLEDFKKYVVVSDEENDDSAERGGE